jgi:hypothetical protein
MRACTTFQIVTPAQAVAQAYATFCVPAYAGRTMACGRIHAAAGASSGTRGSGLAGEPDGGSPVHSQALGGKNTRARTSMLSLGGASAGARGLSNEVWNDSLARPSLALSWTRIRITSSGCCAEK